MSKQVLISYATEDKEVAFRICDLLEDAGLPCWIAPRDILPGSDWSGAIVKALGEVSLVVLVFSSAADASQHVPREVERADSKHKPVIPFAIEDAVPTKSLEYYLGLTQWIKASSGSVEAHFPQLLRAIRAILNAPAEVPSEVSAPALPQVTDADLVALARSVCWNIHDELRSPIRTEEVSIAISEAKQGQIVHVIDVICNKIARETIAKWSKRHQCEVLLVGEDIAPVKPTAERPPVICCLDSLDGTQHWLRSRNLYCTALSIFNRGADKSDPYRLRVSAVQNAEGTIFFAREDLQASFINDNPDPVSVPKKHVTELGKAHVCTVARRPNHFQILMPCLAKGSPFQGLYTFAGNPMLCELILGRYDAVFQPDATSIGDSQQIWDWLPGGHVWFRAGGSIVDIKGQPLDVLASAEACLAGKRASFPFTAANPDLAKAIVKWLADI